MVVDPLEEIIPKRLVLIRVLPLIEKEVSEVRADAVPCSSVDIDG